MRFILSMLTIFTLGLGVLTACQDTTAPNRTEQAKTNASPTNASPAATAKTDDHADTAPRITLAEAKTHFDADDAVFVDTRAAEAYNLERIKGAINITPNNVETMYKNLPKDKKIIVYCS